MSRFQLPWEEERIKIFIETFQCKVMDLQPVEEERQNVVESTERREGD